MIGLKKYFVLFFLLVYNILVFGQTPVIVPLDHNPTLRSVRPTMLKNSVQADTVSLPFFDDFSDYWRSPHPDQSLWMDRHVYINNSFPILPPSNGVATFDALDADGNIYRNPSSSSFPADTLTSRPIRLSQNDNDVFLSFFYQPQGFGDRPDPGDSLILQFKSYSDEWKTVWKADIRNVGNAGNRISSVFEWIGNEWVSVWEAESAESPPFKPVVLPVEGAHLHRGFQFRFVNYVSLDRDQFNPGRRGNADHWHVDYVRLDRNRHENDTAKHDVAMIAPMRTLIRGYQSIPWNQFEFAAPLLLESMVEMTYRNNNNATLAVYRNFTITDVYNNTKIDLSGGALNIRAGEIITFRQNIINPFISTSVDSALFEVKGYLETDQNDWKANDTVRFSQFFSNYFARDDGSPESGYGFLGPNAQNFAVACRFETFMPDYLRAVKLYFSPTDNNATARYRFRIAVWRDDNGRPGEQIYLSSREYRPENFGQFTRFDLGRDVFVANRFWVGWVQVTSGFLNVGFDLNHNDRGNLWFNTGSWHEDSNNGTLMIRPVLGKRDDLQTPAELPALAANTQIKIYPNPASQLIRIEIDTSDEIVFTDYEIEIFDVVGRLLYRTPYTNDYIDVSGLESGFYLIRLINRKTMQFQTERLVIFR